jgi:GNAT superfamily N-acetyltransferase
MEVRVEALSPQRLADYLAFFDGPAFCNNPDWASCYCHYYHASPRLDWSALTGSENRTAMGSRIEVGEMEGFLAYQGDTVVGWLNAQPRHKLPYAFARLKIPPTEIEVPPQDVAMILCFVIHPGHRRQGLAAKLLEAAIANFRQRGFAFVEAYPFKAGDDPDTDYHGPRKLYDCLGFEVFREHENLSVMRKPLSP